MQRSTSRTWCTSSTRLRSSPGPETGCSRGRGRAADRRDRVAILTRSGDRVQHVQLSIRNPLPGVAILTRSGDRVQLVSLEQCAPVYQVAILTRSGDRVQRDPDDPFYPPPPEVAILTRSGDRVQQSSGPRPARAGTRCDPHPVRRPGAARASSIRTLLGRKLRSSPGPETGCSDLTFGGTSAYQPQLRSSPGPETGCSADRVHRSRPQLAVAILTRSGDRVQRVVAGPDDAAPLAVAILTRSGDRVQPWIGSPTRPARRQLRSSPGPETGCSQQAQSLGRAAGGVAILTRSGDRVQRHQDRREVRRAAVAILTRSGDRVQRGPGGAGTRRPPSCDPHPVRRPGAAGARAGADATRARVAILTRSGDRVQRRTARAVARTPTRCDPHPVRRPGAACFRWARTQVGRRCCDPHPVRRPGAARSPWTIRACGTCCDPHPVRRPGAATPSSNCCTSSSRCCDPHPVRRPGAAVRHPPWHDLRLDVAILTRSGDRVQRRA